MYGSARNIFHNALTFFLPDRWDSRGAWQPAARGPRPALDVEPEVHDIALTDDIFLTLEA
jgi:hypothetical protein